MVNKSGRRNLRHARVGEPASAGRTAFSRDLITTRLLCVEFQLPGEQPDSVQVQEPVELFFKPIPATAVMKLQTLKGEASFSFMLDILAKYVVDPATGQSVATVEEWDQFGIDGIQAAIQAMVDGSRGASGGSSEGPTSAASTDAMYQAAKEMMQGDPAMAEAFLKAAQETAIQQQPVEEGNRAGKQDSPTETEEGSAEVVGQENQVSTMPPPTPVEPPNGTSDETPLSDSPSSSMDT